MIQTGVLVLAIATASVLPDGYQLWLAFGHGCKNRATFGTYRPMTSQLIWARNGFGVSSFFMPSLDVTPYLLSMALERKLPGRHGDHFYN